MSSILACASTACMFAFKYAQAAGQKRRAAMLTTQGMYAYRTLDSSKLSPCSFVPLFNEFKTISDGLNKHRLSQRKPSKNYDDLRFRFFSASAAGDLLPPFACLLVALGLVSREKTNSLSDDLPASNDHSPPLPVSHRLAWCREYLPVQHSKLC